MLWVGPWTCRARAQEASISATKAVDQGFSQNLYGRIEVRHDAQILKDRSGEVVSQPAFLDTRPILDGKFYDKRLDTKVTYFILKRPATDQVTQRRPEWESKYSLLALDYGTTMPMVKAYLPFQGSGTNAEVGFREIGSVPFALKAANAKLFYQVDAVFLVASRDKDAVIENGTDRSAKEYGLVGKEGSDGKVNEPGFKRDPTYKSVFLYGVILRLDFCNRQI